jgi:hypothetical protein
VAPLSNMAIRNWKLVGNNAVHAVCAAARWCRRLIWFLFGRCARGVYCCGRSSRGHRNFFPAFDRTCLLHHHHGHCCVSVGFQNCSTPFQLAIFKTSNLFSKVTSQIETPTHSSTLESRSPSFSPIEMQQRFAVLVEYSPPRRKHRVPHAQAALRAMVFTVIACCGDVALLPSFAKGGAGCATE